MAAVVAAMVLLLSALLEITAQASRQASVLQHHAYCHYRQSHDVDPIMGQTRNPAHSTSEYGEEGAQTGGARSAEVLETRRDARHPCLDGLGRSIVYCVLALGVLGLLMWICG